MNTNNKETNQLKEDLVTIFNDALDCISEGDHTGDYVGDLDYLITGSYSMDGSFTCNRFKAEESLLNYLKNYSDLMGDIVEIYSESYNMHLGVLFFKNPESFQVCILIELTRLVLNNNKQFSKLNSNAIIYEDEKQDLENILQTIIKDLKANKIDLNNLL